MSYSRYVIEMDPGLAPGTALELLEGAAAECHLDFDWWQPEGGRSSGLAIIEVLEDGQAAALHDLLNGDVSEAPGIAVFTKVRVDPRDRASVAPAFDRSAWVDGSNWIDWSAVTLPDHYEARSALLPLQGSFKESELAGMEGGKWQNAWLWFPGAALMELPPQAVSAAPPPGVEGIGKWIWTATKSIVRYIPQKIARDLVIQGGVYVGQRVYRWQKAEHIKFREYHDRQEQMQRIALRLERQRQQRLSGSNSARWRQHYNQVDRMIAINR